MKSRVIAGLAAIAISGLAAPGISSADPADQTISGTMTNLCSTTELTHINIILQDLDGNPVGQTEFPNSDGHFQFTVAPGEYKVLSYPGQGCGATPDAAIVDTTTGPVTGVDFTMFNVYTITGAVTGCPGGPDAGVPDTTVQLLDSAETVVDEQSTSLQGGYTFRWMRAAADYTVKVVPPAGCTGDPLTQSVDLGSADVSNVDFALVEVAPEPEPEPEFGSSGLGSLFGSLETVFGSLGSSSGSASDS